MSITAVTLSKTPMAREFAGLEYLNHVSEFSDIEGLLSAYFDAALRVRTEHFFFLDDDDDLPADYLSVLEDCLAAGVALAYTDEQVRTPTQTWVRSPGEYSVSKLLDKPTLLHHLALCRTKDTHEAIGSLPRGLFVMEPYLYSALADRGCAHIPRVGYIWNRGTTGMHRHPSTVRGYSSTLRWLQQKYHATAAA